MVRSPYYQQQLTEGLLYQKYHPDIHCFSFTDFSKETVDAAFDLITSLDKEYGEQGKHVKYLYLAENVSYTPYLIQKLHQSINLMPKNLKHSSAIVTDSFFSKVLETVILPQISKHIVLETQFFATEAEAFDWLDERRKSTDA